MNAAVLSTCYFCLVYFFGSGTQHIYGNRELSRLIKKYMAIYWSQEKPEVEQNSWEKYRKRDFCDPNIKPPVLSWLVAHLYRIWGSYCLLISSSNHFISSSKIGVDINNVAYVFFVQYVGGLPEEGYVYPIVLNSHNFLERSGWGKNHTFDIRRVDVEKTRRLFCLLATTYGSTFWLIPKQRKLKCNAIRKFYVWSTTRPSFSRATIHGSTFGLILTLCIKSGACSRPCRSVAYCCAVCCSKVFRTVVRQDANLICFPPVGILIFLRFLNLLVAFFYRVMSKKQVVRQT